MKKAEQALMRRAQPAARTRGLRMQRSTVRYPWVSESYGTYRLTDRATGEYLGSGLLPDGFGLTLRDAVQIISSRASPVRGWSWPPYQRL
jgi:hypothetical protein